MTFTTDPDFAPDDPTFTTAGPVNLVDNNVELGISIQPTGSSRIMISGAVNVRVRRGKIVSVKVWVAETAVFHEASDVWKTEVIPVDPPVTPSAGAILHIDADGLALTKVHDKRAPSIGTISIGDVVLAAAQ